MHGKDSKALKDGVSNKTALGVSNKILSYILNIQRIMSVKIRWGFQQNHVGGFQQKIPILLAFWGSRSQQNKEKGFQQNFVVLFCILYSYVYKITKWFPTEFCWQFPTEFHLPKISSGIKETAACLFLSRTFA